MNFAILNCEKNPKASPLFSFSFDPRIGMKDFGIESRSIKFVMNIGFQVCPHFGSLTMYSAFKKATEKSLWYYFLLMLEFSYMNLYDEDLQITPN